MVALVFIVDVLSLALGVFSLTALACLAARGEDEGNAAFILPYCALLAISLHQFLLRYCPPSALRSLAELWSPRGQLVGRAILACGWILGSRRLRSLMGAGKDYLVVGVLLAAQALSALLVLAGPAIDPRLPSEAIADVVAPLGLLYSAMSAFVVATRRPPTLPSVKVSLVLAGFSCLVYPLVSIADALDFSYPFVPPETPVWLQTQLVYHLAMSLLLLPYLVRALARGPARPEGPSLESFGLTERERQVAELLLAGESNKDIAFKLGLSLATVKTHANRIYRKTGAPGRADLSRLLGGAEAKPSPQPPRRAGGPELSSQDSPSP